MNNEYPEEYFEEEEEEEDFISDAFISNSLGYFEEEDEDMEESFWGTIEEIYVKWETKGIPPRTIVKAILSSLVPSAKTIKCVSIEKMYKARSAGLKQPYARWAALLSEEICSEIQELDILMDSEDSSGEHAIAEEVSKAIRPGIIQVLTERVNALKEEEKPIFIFKKGSETYQTKKKVFNAMMNSGMGQDTSYLKHCLKSADLAKDKWKRKLNNPALNSHSKRVLHTE